MQRRSSTAFEWLQPDSGSIHGRTLTLSSHFCPGLSPLRDPYTMQRGNPSVGTTTAGLLYPGVRPRTHDGTSEKLWRFGDRQCRPLWRGGVKACSTPEQINCIELT